MADKTSSRSYSPKRTDSMIGPGVRFEGRIEFSGVLRIVGELIGDVSCPADPQGTLVIEATGRVVGTVKVARLVVKGRLQGPVEANQSIEVESGAEIDGDLVYRRIDVRPGGVVAGVMNPLVARDSGPASHGERAEPASAAEDAPGKDAATTSERALATDQSLRINRYPEPASPPVVAPPPAPRATSAAEAGDRVEAIEGTEANPVAHSSPERRFGWLAGKRSWGVGLALVAAAALWFGRSSPARAPDGAVAGPGVAADGSSPQAVPVSAAPSPSEPAVAASRDEAAPAVAATPPSSSPERPAGDPNKVVAIQGGNAEKSPDIFFLITKEPSVLFKKKSGDPSDGTRIELGRGRNLSLAVSRDELYRVARGRELQLFYQGRKVPPKVIESGDWIRFVPAGVE